MNYNDIEDLFAEYIVEHDKDVQQFYRDEKFDKKFVKNMFKEVKAQKRYINILCKVLTDDAC